MLASAAEKIGGPRYRPNPSGCPSMSPDTVSDIGARRCQNARNQRRTGAGEIGRVKITPTFKTATDGSAKLMSEWMNPQ